MLSNELFRATFLSGDGLTCTQAYPGVRSCRTQQQLLLRVVPTRTKYVHELSLALLYPQNRQQLRVRVPRMLFSFIDFVLYVCCSDSPLCATFLSRENYCRAPRTTLHGVVYSSMLLRSSHLWYKTPAATIGVSSFDNTSIQGGGASA